MKVRKGQFVVYYPIGSCATSLNGELVSNAAVAAGVVNALKEGGSISCPQGWKIDCIEPCDVKPEDITDEMLEKWEDLMSHGRGAWDMVDHKELMAAAINVFLAEPKEVDLGNR